jgi:predicted secreted protein
MRARTFAACLMAGSLVAALPIPAIAGDFAERSILGFSPNGDRFAFEEFGIQDGSGFPYANLFVLDTTRDSWVAGTPVRVRLDDETKGIAAARSAAAQKAAPLLGDIDQPGTLLASNPITESGRDPYSIAFRRHPVQQLDGPELTVSLTPIPLDAPNNSDPDYKTQGFRLVLKDERGETVLHEDKMLPASRGIALDYRINDVIIHQRFGLPATLVVLVMVLTRGFEGPDGRYIAVATQLP